jgi:hypothetical protein
MASVKWLVWDKWAQKLARAQLRSNIKTLLETGDVTQAINAGLRLARKLEGAAALAELAENRDMPVSKRTVAITTLKYANSARACVALDTLRNDPHAGIRREANTARPKNKRPRHCAVCGGKPLRNYCRICDCHFCELCILSYLPEAQALIARATNDQDAPVVDITTIYKGGDAFCPCCFPRKVERWSLTSPSLRSGDFDLRPHCGRL